MAVATRSKPGLAAGVRRYAEGVVNGDVIAGNLVHLACERHLRDLEHGHERGLRFSARAAEDAFEFFGFLKHSKGEWSGEPFELQPWQEFIIGSIFGWKREDGRRRFRFAYVEVPRKSGKSTMSAGVGLYLFLADGEAGAEVYSAATKRDQARIVHSEAIRMVQASPFLSSKIKVFKDNLHIVGTASKYEPLGADDDTMDGLNVHGAIIDELHAHKTGGVLSKLDTATGARRQPLIFAITTAGYDRNSVCWQQRTYASNVLKQIADDDTVFGYIATLDEGDDWQAPGNWAKANPNLGVSVKLDDLTRKAEKARLLPSEQNSFMQLHLNVWTQSSVRFIDMHAWDACADPVDADALKARTCYGGLDLSSTTDLSALALVFPVDEDTLDVLAHFWLPEDDIRERSIRDGVPYQEWADRGYLTLTPGNVIDYSFIRARVLDYAATYEMVELAYDPYNAMQLVLQLQDELGTERLVPVRQGFLSLSPPTKELQKRVLGRRIRHGGNPVLRWNADNLMVVRDATDNLKPDKQKSTQRIDGMLALIMSIDRATRHEGGGSSVYNERGLITL